MNISERELSDFSSNKILNKFPPKRLVNSDDRDNFDHIHNFCDLI